MTAVILAWEKICECTVAILTKVCDCGHVYIHRRAHNRTFIYQIVVLYPTWVPRHALMMRRRRGGKGWGEERRTKGGGGGGAEEEGKRWRRGWGGRGREGSKEEKEEGRGSRSGGGDILSWKCSLLPCAAYWIATFVMYCAMIFLAFTHS